MSVITPNIVNATPVYFAAGASLPAGRYEIRYIAGAVRYSAGDAYRLNKEPSEYRVIINDVETIPFGGDSVGYAVPALLEAAKAGQALVFDHTGGKIGMFLSDATYGDNTAVAAPSFQLVRRSITTTDTEVENCCAGQSSLPPVTYRRAFAYGTSTPIDAWYRSDTLPPLPLDVFAFVDGECQTLTPASAVSSSPPPGDIVTLWQPLTASDIASGCCIPPVVDEVTPDVLSNTVSYFSAGASFPPGMYRVTYVRGAMKYDESAGWTIRDPIVGNNGFRIEHSGDLHISPGTGDAPGTATEYASVELCEAGNGGLFVDFMHTGGQIGIWLSDGVGDYGDNEVGPPGPTFNLEAL